MGLEIGTMGMRFSFFVFHGGTFLAFLFFFRAPRGTFCFYHFFRIPLDYIAIMYTSEYTCFLSLVVKSYVLGGCKYVKIPRISSVGYPQIYTGGSYPLFFPYRGLLWVLWPQFHNTLYFCEFCDSCTTIPYTSVRSVTDQVPHRDYPERYVYNTLHFSEFCDSCTTIPYTSVSSVTHPVPYRDYPPVL